MCVCLHRIISDEYHSLGSLWNQNSTAASLVVQKAEKYSDELEIRIVCRKPRYSRNTPMFWRLGAFPRNPEDTAALPHPCPSLYSRSLLGDSHSQMLLAFFVNDIINTA